MKTQNSMLIIQRSITVLTVSTLQVAVFIFFYQASLEVFVLKYGSLKSDLGYGIQMEYGINLLSVLAVINSLILIFVSSVKAKWTFVVSLAVVWLIYWSNIIAIWPNRFLLISALGIIGLFAGVLCLVNVKPSVDLKIK